MSLAYLKEIKNTVSTLDGEVADVKEGIFNGDNFSPDKGKGCIGHLLLDCVVKERSQSNMMQGGEGDKGDKEIRG